MRTVTPPAVSSSVVGMRAVVAVVTLCVTLLLGCTGGSGGGPSHAPRSSTTPSVRTGMPQRVSATVPRVRGLQALRALGLMHAAGFGRVRFAADRAR
jgi:hypothetical protein